MLLRPVTRLPELGVLDLVGSTLKRKKRDRTGNEDDEKDRTPNKVVPIHQRELPCRAKSMVLSRGVMIRMKRDTEGDEKDRSLSKKVDPIPHLDLENDILTRLPAKSLMKFICVSKMWSSIIRSQRFVNSYYAMSSTMRSRFIITFSNGAFAKNDDERLFIFSSSYEGEESSSLETNLDMTIPSVSFCRGSKCLSVHGLIGFSKSGLFTVCNPSMKKVTILPCAGAHTQCLGYDPVDDQFKALTLESSPYRANELRVHEVLTLGGGESSWSRTKVTSPTYYYATKGICINGFVYSGAWAPRRREDPVIVCFDVRYERISFIKAPLAVVCWEGESILIEYKGKLASIARHPYASFHSFELWILEDVEKQDWSWQTFVLPYSLGIGKDMTSPGTNKAGEIIFAPRYLSNNVEPFYIFYYNVERKDMRRVRLLGIADTEEFRRNYGITGECCVYMSAKHVESMASL